MEKLPFERKYFCGHEFNWYMVDRDGCIAQVDTGYSPLPVTLFTDEQRFNFVWQYFEGLPPSTTARPSAALCASKQAEPGFDHSAYLREAERGLYFYEETHYGPLHDLIALPQTPLTIDRVPEPVRAFLEDYRLPQLSFETLPNFNVEELFNCREPGQETDRDQDTCPASKGAAFATDETTVSGGGLWSRIWNLFRS